MNTEIRVLTASDEEEMYEVINTAAEAYSGLIPEESDTEPYMPMDELRSEVARMTFFGATDDRLLGVIGIQERDDVSLIRHLYVRPTRQRSGIGTRLLERAIRHATAETVLVGTWAAADWAISFYEKNGFENLGADDALLSNYWDIPEYQRSSSVVLHRE
jgi:GNAT superfamily N-acetyltransferase